LIVTDSPQEAVQVITEIAMGPIRLDLSGAAQAALVFSVKEKLVS